MITSHDVERSRSRFASVLNLEQIYPLMAQLCAKKWIPIWRPPPFWILREISQTSSETSFLSNYLQIRQNGAVNSYGRCHLGFLHYMNFRPKSRCETPFSASISILVQMYLNFWPTYGQKCDFQYGSCRHLGFCGYQFCRKSQLWNLIFPIWVKLVRMRSKMAALCHLTDFKMAAAAILNFLPVSIFVIWSSLGSGWGCFCRIS